MKHLTLPRFWQYYQQLPPEVRELADKNYELLKVNPYHASLHFKKVGKQSSFGRYEWASITGHWGGISRRVLSGFG